MEYLARFFLLGLSLVSFCSLPAQAQNKKLILFYDSKKALAYADKWCQGGNDCTSGINGQFHADNNTDCTHFMSHILAAGGVEVPGKGAKCAKGLCIRVIELGDWLDDASKTYVNVSRIGSWKETRQGDLAFAQDFIFRPWQLQIGPNDRHVMLLAEPSKADHAAVYSHTANKCGTPTAHFDPTVGVFYRIDQSPLEGRWQSLDADRRFQLNFTSKSVRWKESRKSGEGTTFERSVNLAELKDGAYQLTRSNDDSTLQALGFSDAELRAAILSQNPEPSTLTFRWENGKVVGEWRGLSVRKKSDGTFDSLVQPSAATPKPFTFGRE